MTDTPDVDGNMIGDLLLGERQVYRVGACTVRPNIEFEITVDADADGEVEVEVEGSYTAATVSGDYWTESILDGREIRDHVAIAEIVNAAIESEQAKL